jgi:hypothetical protein
MGELLLGASTLAIKTFNITFAKKAGLSIIASKMSQNVLEVLTLSTTVKKIKLGIT